MEYEQLKEYFHSFRQGLIGKNELIYYIFLWQLNCNKERYNY